ncbi:MAG: nucleotide exchange factor GrpE [Gammaproteobacteria bacterium]|jgi:molecular chaperone GrpE
MGENTELNPSLEENLDLETIQQKISQLQAELIAAENKAAENWELLLRTKADEENTRKRARLDVESAHKYGIERFARSMLNIVDSLERGIELSNTNNNEQDQANQNNIIKGLKEGMDLTLKLLLDTLDQFGIKMLNPVGEMFNPVQHEALSMQEQENSVHNSILLVVQKGFIMHDRVLRPARVIVAKNTNLDS